MQLNLSTVKEVLLPLNDRRKQEAVSTVKKSISQCENFLGTLGPEKNEIWNDVISLSLKDLTGQMTVAQSICDALLFDGEIIDVDTMGKDILIISRIVVAITSQLKWVVEYEL